MARKAIIDFTDAEIDDELRKGIERVEYFTNDFLAERGRRRATRREDVLMWTAILAAGASIVSAVIALVAVLGS